MSCVPEARAKSNPSSSSSVAFELGETLTYSFDGTPTGNTSFVLPRLANSSFEPLYLRIFGIFGLSRRSSHKKSELSLHQMAVRAFFGQKIRAERPSNGCADDLRTKIRAERLSNGYRSQGPTEPPLHRNSVLLVEAHWSVASCGRSIAPDFGPRPLCVLESSCLLLSRTATHGQSPGACVDVPSLTYSLCWRSHKRREALRPRLCLPNSLS